jgi:uncharacterized protein (DUF433 family)
MATTLDSHIEVTQGKFGARPRIAGHRIKVQDVVIWHDRLGIPVAEIVARHNLTPADAHAAMAYYFDHREEIDRSIAEDDALVEALRAETPSLVAEKLRQ